MSIRKRLFSKTSGWVFGICLATLISVIYVVWAYNQPKGRLLYAKYLGGNNAGVYVMDPNGENVERLTSFPYIQAPVNSPVWSADGNQIAFVGDGASGRNIYLINQEGMFNYHSSLMVDNLITPENVPPNFCDEDNSRNGGYQIHSLSWSPDGQRLAFTCASQRQTDELVCIVNLQKEIDCWSISVITGATPKIRGIPKVDWSPVRARLAISFELAGDKISKVYLADLDGRNAVFLVEGKYPRWSSNGQQLLFFQTGRLCIIRQDGSDFQCVYEAPGHLSGSHNFDEKPLLINSTATWSPDGRFIAFSASHETSSGGHAVHILNLRTKTIKRITVLGDGVFSDPDWSP
jgi:WD40 repeat protein